jgi:hypothetical protein
MFNWDYINIGTLGFAQVGRPQYENKIEVEKQVINAFYSSEELKVPEEFRAYAHFTWKRNQHDFGSYLDFNIKYDRSEVDDWEYNEEEEWQDKFNRFWEWVNLCEEALYKEETEMKLLELMEQLYQKTITMEVVHRDLGNKYQGLKAV